MGNWLVQSFTAVMFLIPPWVAIGFFARNYQIKPEVFLIWYFLGVAAMSAIFGGVPLTQVAPSWKVVGVILLIGLTVGGFANMLLFRAVAGAPNPGLPVALSNVASVGVFVVAGLLAWIMPQYFDKVKMDIWSLAGIALVIVGAAIIAIRR
jgi:drug/metabolite transporter (DMT)-like permease